MHCVTGLCSRTVFRCHRWRLPFFRTISLWSIRFHTIFTSHGEVTSSFSGHPVLPLVIHISSVSLAFLAHPWRQRAARSMCCLLYTSDAADDLLCVDLGGRRILKKKK